MYKYNTIVTQHDIVIIIVTDLTVYIHISKQSMMWIQNLNWKETKSLEQEGPGCSTLVDCFGYTYIWTVGETTE